jgi:lipid-binding SYLF domain-containing protein
MVLTARIFPAIALALFLGACVSGANVSDKRATVQQMRAETLAKLYKLEPGAKTRIRKAAGYAVFSNVGVNVILVSAGGGWGVVRNNGTRKDTFMRMASAGLGLGLGVKDFRGVFVFTDKKYLNWFVERGWDASAQADAAAKAGSKGDAWAGAVDVAPGIKLYQITENGLALQATIQGTKYWKDGKLNSG